MHKAIAAIAAAALIAGVISVLWEFSARAQQPSIESKSQGARAFSTDRSQRSWPYYEGVCASDRPPLVDCENEVRIVFIDRL